MVGGGTVQVNCDQGVELDRGQTKKNLTSCRNPQSNSTNSKHVFPDKQAADVHDAQIKGDTGH